MDYENRITVEESKRGGNPCIRNSRITVYEILRMRASGMDNEDILKHHPELELEDILACLAFAAEHDNKNHQHSNN
ncbi:MAG: DUF433 domain-containing protein [Nitrosomonas sp.]|nr:DUF433 domain-containing protein [Nitrosomonas sp.]